MMFDVERILAETSKYDDTMTFSAIERVPKENLTVLFADDSSVARGQIERTLTALGVKFVGAVNGRAAWDELQKIAGYATASGRQPKDLIQLILTDVEMPA